MLSNPLLLGDTGSYQIQRSLRLRSSATAYLSRTFGTPTNNTVWTFSCWLKQGDLSTVNSVFGGNVTSSGAIGFTAGNALAFWGNAGSQVAVTTAVYRDPSAHGHLVVISNGTTIKGHWNGAEVLSYTGTITTLNSAIAHSIGKDYGGGTSHFDGLLSEFVFVDGQALTPSSFGQTDPTTGQWTAKKYTGTYGTNGFYLPFTDNTALTTSSNVGLGKDFSGNGNYFVTNNVSITAGATYDSMLDVPLAYGTTDRGNFATLNPIATVNSGSGIKDGNLRVYQSVADIYNISTISMTTGKWYAEMTVAVVGTESSCGIASSAAASGNNYVGANAASWGYYFNGNKYTGASPTAYGTSYTTGDVIGVAFDADVRTLTFYKNNVSQGAAFTGLAAGAYFFAVSGRFTTAYNDVSFNFGQRPFTYTPPTGFKALHTGNLQASSILKSSTQSFVVLDTGASILATAQAGFPSNYMAWIKDRANANNHQIIDTVRGASAVLQSNTTAAETTYTAPSGNSVGWLWKAGGAAVTNTAGSISAQVSANAQAGFSIVSYNGSGAAATIGHGLGVTPAMIIVKCRVNATPNWRVWHKSLGTVDSYLGLNQTAAVASSTTVFNGQSSSTFTIGSDPSTNSASGMLALVFSEIAGYSKFGEIAGTGSTDGVFAYCGFTPRFILIGPKSHVTNWWMFDTARGTYNVVGETLYANLTNAESVSPVVDVVSNGFKLRSSAQPNTSGQSYVFMAIASTPFQSALAR